MSEMSCAATRDQFALMLYGELSFDEEERVETHLDGCAECRAVLEQQRSLHATFDSLAVEPPASLLRECRAERRSRGKSGQCRRIRGRIRRWPGGINL